MTRLYNNLISSRNLGIFYFTLHLVISCLNDVLFKLLGQSLPCVQVTFMRFFFAAITVLGYGIYQNSSFKTNHLHIHALRGLTLFVGMSLWCLGLAYNRLADAVIINFTIPLFLLVFCSLFLKEKVGVNRWIATLISFIGVAIVANPVSANFNPYCLIMILTAAIFASCDIINKLYASKESMICSLFYTAAFTAFFAFCALGIFALYTKNPIFASQSGVETFYTILLGIGANITFYLILKSFTYIEASETASIRYWEIFFSAISGYIFFGEIPAKSTLLGAAIVVPTTIFVILQENKNEKQLKKEVTALKAKAA